MTVSASILAAETAQRILAIALAEAVRMRTGSIGTEHLAFALLRDDRTPASECLRKHGVDRQLVISLLIEFNPQGKNSTVWPRPDRSAERAVRMALQFASQLGEAAHFEEHLFSAILSDRECMASAVFAASGLTLSATQQSSLNNNRALNLPVAPAVRNHKHLRQIPQKRS